MGTFDLVSFAFAIIICTAAVPALVGHVLRPQPTGRLLLSFGLFAAIYGSRMFFKQPLATALGISSTTALWIESGLNYFILIPALLFIEELCGLGWHRALRWVTIGTAVFAVAAVIADRAAGLPNRVPDPSLPLMFIVATVVLVSAVAGYRPPRFVEWRILVAGIATFLLFVLNDHAVAADVVPWHFSAEPIGFLVLLGSFGYIALTRVFAQERQLIAVEQEMRSAREIQTSILPHDLPSTGRVRIAARYEPLAAVAGDFYDVVPMDDGAVAVIVADVSGHGIPAALIASMVKVAFAAGLRETQDPAELLERMNLTLCGLFDRSYVTAACALVRPDERVVNYAAAGHPPPLLVPGGDSTVLRLEERGLFLGVMPSAEYTTATVTVAGGARLIVYSDGLTETPGRNEELFGIERLTAFADEDRNKPPAVFADALMTTLRRFADRETLPHDDVTLVVVDLLDG
jgi:sigma-B regulation protein RsbU (phosphoserine phosphatase)